MKADLAELRRIAELVRLIADVAKRMAETKSSSLEDLSVLAIELDRVADRFDAAAVHHHGTDDFRAVLH